MFGRLYPTVVILLWLASMSWLVGRWVLPSLTIGDAPTYDVILEERGDAPPVGWVVDWNNERLGESVTVTERPTSGGTAVRSRVRLDRLPLEDLAKNPFLRLLGLGDGLGDQLKPDVRSRIYIDPLGRLSTFESALRVTQDDSMAAVRIRGRIEQGVLSLSMRVGDLKQEHELPISNDMMFSDGLSPESRLPNLRVGQKWTVDVYSPIQMQGEAEILHCRVEQAERIQWQGEIVRTLLVIYRNDDRSEQGRAWVRQDGLVLRQEVRLMGSKLCFTRMSDAEASVLATKIDTETP